MNDASEQVNPDAAPADDTDASDPDEVPEAKQGTVDDPNVVDPYAHLRDLGRVIEKSKEADDQ